jgi:hypothetical protein
MSFSTGKFGKWPGSADEKLRGKGKDGIARIRALGMGIVALRRAVVLNQTSVVRIDGQRVAILPLRDHRRLERLLEQEEKEKELDRLDVEEAERRLADPGQIPIPFERAVREIELGELSD